MKEGKLSAAISLEIFILLFSFFVVEARAELIDRVAAFVDDRAITSRELRETYERTAKADPGISMDEVLNTMVNRLLLLNDARKLKLEAKTDDEILNEYEELKVKALIRVKEEDIEAFYKNNQQEFGGASYETVRDKIEEYLMKKEANELLKKQIADLRAKAYVKILLNTPQRE